MITVEIEEYEKFRKPIQDIINFANTIDEKYREKCFEVFLVSYLNAEKKITASEADKNEIFGVQAADLKVFLQQNKVTEEILNRLFLRQSGQTLPLYKISEKRKPVAQIQIALLAAFENALITSDAAFEFSIKAVRQRCVDRNLYDGADFMNNFRNRAGLFTRLDNESDTVKLSPLGKTELANVIFAVANQ
jgi:hypothetical protein